MLKSLLKIKKLNKREKYIIYGAVGILAVLGIHRFIVTPFFESKSRMQRALQRKQEMIVEMKQWQSDYQAIKQTTKISRERFDRRAKGFELYSFLNKMAGKTGIQNRITSMKPTKTAPKNSKYQLSRVDMKVDSIGLEQLVNYLYEVETSENIVEIKKLTITKKDKKKGLISVVMQVEAIEI